MKTAIRYYSALLIAFSISFITLANDTASRGDKKDPSSDKVEFRFIGNIKEHPVYQLTLNGTENEEYVVSFRETDGTVVYSEVVKGNFSQRFMLRAGDAADKTLRMEIKDKNTNKSRVYLISTTESLVSQNVVVKLQ